MSITITVSKKTEQKIRNQAAVVECLKLAFLRRV